MWSFFTNSYKSLTILPRSDLVTKIREIRGGIIIGKVMVFMLSDSEEHIFDKVKETIKSESAIEYIEEISEPVLSFQGISVHLRNETISLNGKLIKLSHQEFLTLHCLIKHPGWIFTKEQIYNEVYSREKPVNVDNAVYCLIRDIRKKLRGNGSRYEYIQTVRGVGYKFVIPEE